MNNYLISPKTARLAKQKKFNVGCTYYYDFSECVGRGSVIDVINWNKSNDSIYSAPTQSLLQTWLREIHDIHIQVLINSWSERTYCYKIHSEKAYIPDSSKFVLDSDIVIGKYVDVLEKALHHGLNLIKE